MKCFSKITFHNT